MSKRAGYRRELIWLTLLSAGGAAAVTLATIPSTLVDFHLFGTQPNNLFDPIASANTECVYCHGNFNAQTEPYTPWAASMMGQSARDPLFYAALAIANNDAAFAGDLCLRCHAPGGWVQGRSEPTDGSALTGVDFEGVTCNFCHRMVDPIYQAGNPREDADILANVGPLPAEPHSGDYILDPVDRRRGPFDLGPNFFPHQWLQSPFHTSARMCATCHDVSNPLYERQPDGHFALGALNAPHTTQDERDMFPIERTYSEWSASAFAQGPINMNGRFGGNLLAVSSCQDCHMPQTTGQACFFGQTRNDLPTHYFNGGNTWVLNAVRNLYHDADTGLTDQSVADSISRATTMLQLATDFDSSIVSGQLRLRVTNQTGHKLPSGYPEGRRVWINVQFYNAQHQLIAERGAYDATTATLTTADTKVYEAQLGIDQAVSTTTGIPVGPTFHFALNNKVYKDNRIPPRGFTNAGFAAIQSPPVNYTYADGQYWDDTLYDIPAGATSAVASLYYQNSSKEYVQFLRDNAPAGSTAGQTVYDQWALTGMSTPVLMHTLTLLLNCYANCDNSTIAPILNVNDFICFQTKFANADSYANCDNSTTPPVLNVNDFICFMSKFANGCS